ncbi:MAG: trigger factor [Acidobacteriota bacterium]
MRIEVSEPSQIRRKLTIEVPPEQVKAEYSRAEQETRRHAEIPGFRKGKVPIDVIRGRFRKLIEKEANESLVKSSLEEALKEKGLEPVGSPQVADLKSTYGESLQYEVEFEIMPKLQVEDYKGIQLKREMIPVTDEDVEGRLQEIRKRAAEYRSIDGAATDEHYVVADLQGLVEPGGATVLDQKGVLLSLGPDSDEPLIAAELIGMKASETREFEIGPKEGAAAEALESKTVKYRATVHEVKEAVLPALDDELASSLGDYSSLEDLRTKVRQDLEQGRDQLVRKRYADQVMEYLARVYPIEVPAALYQDYAIHSTVAYKQYLDSAGKQVENVEQEVEKAFTHFAGEGAVYARVSLILEEIARKESISVTTEEVDDRIRRQAEETQKSPEGIKARLGEKGIAQLRHNLLKDKVIDFLVAEARID